MNIEQQHILKQNPEFRNWGNQLDLREYLLKFWRRKWLMIGIPTLIAFFAIIYALIFIRPIYMVSACIAIESSNLLNTSMTTISTRTTRTLDRERILRKIYSSEYLGQLAEQLELSKHPIIIVNANKFTRQVNWLSYDEALNRATLRYLREKLTITVSNTADQFHIAVKDTSPVFAFELVDKASAIFVEKSRQSDLRGIRDVKEFSDEQLVLHKEKLDNAENKLREFNQRIAVDRAQGLWLSDATRKNIMNARDKTEENIVKRTRRLEQIKNRIPKEIVKELTGYLPNLKPIEEKVVQKNDDYRRLLADDQLNSTAELQLINDINLLRLEANRLINKNVENFSKLSKQQHNALVEFALCQFDLFVLNNRQSVQTLVLQSSINTAASEPTIELEKRKLQDDYERQLRTYNLFIEQQRGSQIEEAIQNSEAEYKYQVIIPAQMPIFPVSGSKRNFVVIAFIIGILLSLTLIIVFDSVDQTVRSEKDIQYFLELSILGTIPKMNISVQEYYKQYKNNYKIVGKEFKKENSAIEAQRMRK